MKKVLTIAGSDCSGGAGIQADLKTMTMHGVYGMSVITALTAQNTTGVYGIQEAATSFVAKQLDCVFSDIFPDAVKIGMVSNKEIIEIISDKLTEYKLGNIVVDPVMVSTSGSRLLNDDAMNALVTRLFPLADIITPNIYEAECICGVKIRSRADMILAAEKISVYLKGFVLIKGGHLEDCADDLLYMKNKIEWFQHVKIDNPNTHGTGCTLSSAIASNLAKGYDMHTAVKKAKEYITGALKSGLKLGNGRGPLNHCFPFEIFNSGCVY